MQSVEVNFSISIFPESTRNEIPFYLGGIESLKLLGSNKYVVLVRGIARSPADILDGEFCKNS